MAKAKVRASRYNEVIRIDDGRYFLFNTAKCSADMVSSEVVRLLSALPVSQEDLDGLPDIALDWLEKLSAKGYITNRSPSEEVKDLLDQFMQVRPLYRSRRLHAIVVTHGCNMRCSYCFQADLQHRDLAKVTFPTLNNAMVDRIFQMIATSRAGKTGESKETVLLYGGEPLLLENYDLVQYILEKGESLGYSFGVFTNGYDLRHFVPLLQRHSVQNVHVTVDGPREMHNLLRPHRDGSPTFDRVADAIRQLSKTRIPVTIRVNVNATTARSLPDFWAFAEDEGWLAHPRFNFLVSEIRDGGGCSSCSTTGTPMLPTQARPAKPVWYERPARASLLGTTVLSRVVRGKKPTRFPCYWFCDAHVGLRLYSPDGYVYLCWGLLGSEEARVAQYWPSVEPEDKEVVERWGNRHVFAMRRCYGCKYLLLCGGGCSAEAALCGGDMMESVCWDFSGYLSDVVPNYFLDSIPVAKDDQDTAVTRSGQGRQKTSGR